jgi:hypothetical protein
MNMMLKTRGLTKLVLGLAIGWPIVLGLLHDDQRTNDVEWISALLGLGCAIYLALAGRRWLGTWRGWLGVSDALLIAVVWLRSQWLSTNALTQHLNVSIAWLAWASFIAVFMSSALLLMRGDASVIFIGLACLIAPMALIALGEGYLTSDQTSMASLRDQVFWGVPLIWAICIGGLSFPAFLLHGLIALSQELDARGSRGTSH